MSIDQSLRQRAEAALRETAAALPENQPPLTLEAARTMLHELQVHQIELEMQNEDLCRMLETLDDSRARYFDLYDLAPVAYCTLSEIGLILEANLTLVTRLDVKRGELLGKLFFRFILKEDQNNFFLLRQRLLTTGQPQRCELRMQSCDSLPFWVHVTATAFPEADGTTGMRVALSDINDFRQAEMELQERRKELDCLYAIIALGEEHKSLDEMFQSSVELLPQGWHYPEVAAARILWHGRSYQTFNFRETEWRQSCDLKIAGQTFGRIDLCYLEARPNQDEGPFLKEERELMKAVASKLGRFAERWQMEALLRESEERYRTLFDRANDGITLISTEGELLEINESFARMHGHRQDEMRRMNLRDLDTSKTLEGLPERMRRLLTGEALTFEVEHHHMEGHVFPLEVSASLISVNGRPVLLCFHRDITERKRAEAAMRDNDIRLAVMSHASPVLIWESGPDKLCNYFNQVWLGFTGRTLAQEMGNGWTEGVHPDDLPHCMEIYVSSFDARKEFQMEYRLRRHDGDYRWLLDGGIPRHMADGSFAGYIGSCVDITERKREEMALQNSLAEKEVLLKEVHHRVKNNLQIVTSLLNLENRRSQHPDTKAVLTDMQGRIHTMAQLHESLHLSSNFAAVDLGAYIRNIATQSFWMGDHRTNLVRLTLDLASIPIEMDQAVSCGLLVNELISNCLKHGFPAGRGGEVRIALQPVAGGPQVCLRVSDTGVGLPPNFAAQRGKSLGLQLVSDLSGHLQGTLAIGPEPQAVFAVTFTPQAVKRPKQPIGN